MSRQQTNAKIKSHHKWWRDSPENIFKKAKAAMTENADREIIVLENTRRITLKLTKRGDADRLIEAINARRVKLISDGKLVDGETDEVLGELWGAVNEADYKMAKNQWPPRTHQNCDPYDYGYNDI